jgi:hypothetical protein
MVVSLPVLMELQQMDLLVKQVHLVVFYPQQVVEDLLDLQVALGGLDQVAISILMVAVVVVELAAT